MIGDLIDILIGWGLSWTWTLPSGAEQDVCRKPGCLVVRCRHVGLDHEFVEDGA